MLLRTKFIANITPDFGSGHPPVSLLPGLLEPWHPAPFLAVPSTTFHLGNAPVPQCGAIPGRSQCTLSSRKYSSPSLRHSSCQYPVHDAGRHGTNLTALAEMSCPGTAACTSELQMRSTWAARLTDLYDYAPCRWALSGNASITAAQDSI